MRKTKRHFGLTPLALAIGASLATLAPLSAQPRLTSFPPATLLAEPAQLAVVEERTVLPPPFATLSDSLLWEWQRDRAHTGKGRRLVVSIRERRIWLMEGADTLYVAPIAVGSGDQLEYDGEEWDFSTPVGVRRVVTKEEDPVWIPPLWHYVKVAQANNRNLVQMEPGRHYPLHDGSRLLVRGSQVGQLLPNGAFVPIPPGEEIVFDETVYVPPFGTINREVPGELGAYKLDLGDSYLIHGTPHKDSIGTAATHGCIRLHDQDIEYFYREVAVGTKVILY